MWDENVTGMDTERLLKISRDNILILAEKRTPRCPKKWNVRSLVKTGGTAFNKEKIKTCLRLRKI